MRNIISIVFITFLLLNCSSGPIFTGSLQHYRGERLAPAEESTLHFKYLNRIIVDGVPFCNMEKVEEDGEIVECEHQPRKRWSGLIKVKPGKHDVVVEIDRSTTGYRFSKREIVSVHCSIWEFEPGMEYTATMINRSEPYGTYWKTTYSCRIREGNVK